MSHFNSSLVKTHLSRLQIEKICSAICLVAALVFLVIAILGAWRFIFIAAICLAAGCMVREESASSQKDRESKKS